jgi:hypothetical protein
MNTSPTPFLFCQVVGHPESDIVCQLPVGTDEFGMNQHGGGQSGKHSPGRRRKAQKHVSVSCANRLLLWSCIAVTLTGSNRGHEGLEMGWT